MTEIVSRTIFKDSDTVKRYDYLMEFYKTHAGRYA